ncbi:MAG: hypothetical protein A3B47_02340 [Candidatus Levybacteria bacterium RIFCSPLOWO2_01_FULL_39_24]|nr:MAG: hypothetical protein A2800_01635 [Candidatus Levybacteria bacterium RIFCSPHIGHO2_01_FULL_40_16]OGH28366.1 MAG: hypothetical protein A3E12_01795 [Candidatus Levybacteria bacterium RIFCSPHIGHO2_12_FULL_39_9]OGH46475.1 MAG: hypothetical protein A3B47_02340 [Candidatus Levybacteria bacterium RIFCSPLOWO2_01_FULL_39_24]
MTRKLLILLLPLLLLIFVASVNAENATTGSAQTATDAATKLKLQMQLLQEQKKTTITQIRDDAKALIQAKRDEFKAKLKAIKDQKKKALVDRIDAKLVEVNKKHTARFLEVLTRLQLFLEKFIQSATGSTSAKTLTDITAAQIAIDTAKSAVEAQATKDYTMNIADDTTLKLNAGTTVSQLRLDLMAVYKLVIDAKQAVQKLNTDRSTIKKEATGSANL